MTKDSAHRGIVVLAKPQNEPSARADTNLFPVPCSSAGNVVETKELISLFATTLALAPIVVQRLSSKTYPVPTIVEIDGLPSRGVPGVARNGNPILVLCVPLIPPAPFCLFVLVCHRRPPTIVIYGAIDVKRYGGFMAPFSSKYSA